MAAASLFIRGSLPKIFLGNILNALNWITVIVTVMLDGELLSCNSSMVLAEA